MAGCTVRQIEVTFDVDAYGMLNFEGQVALLQCRYKFDVGVKGLRNVSVGNKGDRGYGREWRPECRRVEQVHGQDQPDHQPPAGSKRWHGATVASAACANPWSHPRATQVGSGYAKAARGRQAMSCHHAGHEDCAKGH